ncbi:MAG: hypothetical protein ACKO3K_19060 [Cuspidothrix sp.]
MTTKWPSLYNIGDSQLSKKNKDQDNIVAFQDPKFAEIKQIKTNKYNGCFSSYRKEYCMASEPISFSEIKSYRKEYCMATEPVSFSEIKQYISRQIKNDNRKIQSIFSDYEFLGSILIKDYFQEHPNKRKALAQNVAKHITSVNLVLEVLDWGTSRKIREGFDATVMLLAECGNVIISSLSSLARRGLGCEVLVTDLMIICSNHVRATSPDNKDLLVLEEKWEILIKSIACSSKISPQKRFDAIIKLIPNSNRRLIKTGIIDALLIMEDEIDIQSIKSQLEYFLSDSEHDEYVKEYAKEAMEDM